MKGITVSINEKSKLRSGKKVSFSAQAFLDSAGVARKIKEFKRGEIVYSQGDAAKSVMHLQEGGVQLSVVNEAGKEAVIAILGTGGFFWERCLAGQSPRIGSAKAITPRNVLITAKGGT